VPKNREKNIAVADLETDPFEYRQMIEPFVAGFYDGHKFISWWSDNCIQQFVDFLKTYPTSLNIYFHNGGRFDFFWLLPYIKGNAKIVNGRIIQAKLFHHELRDSFAILPFALDKYKKTEIDYRWFKRRSRKKHKDIILSYLRDDCTNLYELCDAFLDEFGDKLTIGSASMKQLQKFHIFSKGDKAYDESIRQDFYIGGRTQVFKAGIIHGPIQMFDTNSMYPFVMRNYLHPISTGIYHEKTISKHTAFLDVIGDNFGAFPIRSKNGIDFTIQNGLFHPTIHEFNMALQTGTFKPHRIVRCYNFSQFASFDTFVDHFFSAKTKAAQDHDKIRFLLYKYVLNSAYGKFAQNPAHYSEWWFGQTNELPPDWHTCGRGCDNPCRRLWTPFECNGWYLWQRPIRQENFFNVSTGASITGGARSHLLEGLSKADHPYYCDTDSIICRSADLQVSDTELGAWKLEAKGDKLAIAGKKLYALFSDGECIKKAHKGVRLTGPEIVRIAKGEIIDVPNPVPTFDMRGGQYSFLNRKVRKTC
jgi:DNA polymerase type B, organellar and viral